MPILFPSRPGNEIIIEGEDHRAVAVMKQPQPVGRKISECIALAKAYEEKLGYAPVPDEGFVTNVQEGIDGRREPIRNVWDAQRCVRNQPQVIVLA